MGEFHLHVGNAGAGRGPRRVLNRKLGEPGQFPEAGEVALLRNERVLLVYVDAPKERDGAGFEKNPTVTRVAAPAGLLDGRGLVAIERQRRSQTFGLLAKQRKNSRVAPLGKNHIGVVAFEEPGKLNGRWLARFVELPASTVHFDFEGCPATVRGIDPRKARQPNLHNLEWRHFII